MLRMISDEVRFPEELAAGRIARRVYTTYPYRIYQVMASLQGIDYGFSDQEGLFFRSREFDKRTDATIRYALLIEQF